MYRRRKYLHRGRSPNKKFVWHTDDIENAKGDAGVDSNKFLAYCTIAEHTGRGSTSARSPQHDAGFYTDQLLEAGSCPLAPPLVGSAGQQ